MTHADMDRALTLLGKKLGLESLNEASPEPIRQSLRDLQVANNIFFEKRAAYPSIKKKKDDRGSARDASNGLSHEAENRRWIPWNTGVRRFKWDQPLPSESTSATVIRWTTRRFSVSFDSEVTTLSLPRPGRRIRIDFGISRLTTLSNCECIANPRHLHRCHSRLELLQGYLTHKAKGSKRRLLAKRAIAKCHRKIADTRKEALNRLTTRVVCDFDNICIEDMHLRGTVKNHELARSLTDGGIGMVDRMRKENAARYGKGVRYCDRFFSSSKLSPCCENLLSALPLSIRESTRMKCAEHHVQDINAVRTILTARQAVSACRADVRPRRIPAQKGSRQ